MGPSGSPCHVAAAAILSDADGRSLQEKGPL